MSETEPRDRSASLIDALAADLQPVEPIAPIARTLLGVAAVGALVGALVLGVYGLRPDFLGSFASNATYATVLCGLVLAVGGACTATLASVIPGREPVVKVGATVAGVGLCAAILVSVASTPWGTVQLGAPLSQMACVARGAVFALLPALVLLALAARGWSGRPGWTVGLGLLGTGAAGALLVHLTCPAIDPLHMLCTHVSTPILAAVALTALLTPTMRRFAR